MRNIISMVLLFPIAVFAQKFVPRLEGDTLYTRSGFKMYIGQQIHLSRGSDKDGGFRYVVNSNAARMPLTGTTITIEKFKSFKISALGNGFVWVKVKSVLKDGSESGGSLRIAFDLAIRPLNGGPSEMDVPEEFRKYDLHPGSVADEIKKLKELLDERAITQEEFDIQKKKLLGKS